MLAYVLQMDPPGRDRARTPRLSAQMQGKKQLPPSARCNVHVEVWCVECGVRRVERGMRRVECGVWNRMCMCM